MEISKGEAAACWWWPSGGDSTPPPLPTSRSGLLGHVDAGARRLVLDLEGIEYISSAGLRVLLLVAKKLRTGGGERRVVRARTGGPPGLRAGGLPLDLPHRAFPRGRGRARRHPTLTMPRLRLRIEPPGAAPFSGEYDGPSVVLGRSAQVTVPVADASLSRQHARFFEQDGAWFVEDLGSKNATLLNGRVLTAPTRVASRDTCAWRGRESRSTWAALRPPEAPPEDEPLTGLFQSASAILDRRDEAAPRSLKLLNEVHRALARPITQEALAELILDSAFTHLRPEEGVLFLRKPGGELYRAQSRRLEGAKASSSTRAG